MVPASVLGGNIAAYQLNNFSAEYPGGSDTGIGWTYLRYPHAASTAWAGLLLLYQFDEDDAIDENANPFAPPANPMPNPQQSPPRGAPGWVAAQKYRQCLPITEVPEPALTLTLTLTLTPTPILTLTLTLPSPSPSP